MPDLGELSRRLAAVQATLAQPGLADLDNTLVKAAQDVVARTRKPNFYKWSDATFATRVAPGRLSASGREWAVAERGRQSGRHGRTAPLRTWTTATTDATTALRDIAAREVADRIRKALG